MSFIINYVFRGSVFVAITAIVGISFPLTDSIESRPIAEEIYKFMVSIVAIALPVYITVFSLFLTVAGPKVKRLADIAEHKNMMLESIIPRFRRSYLFTIYTMCCSLAFTSALYLVTMLWSNVFFKNQPKILVLICVFLFLTAIFEALICTMQMAGIMKLVDESGQKIIDMDNMRKTILDVAASLSKESRADNKNDIEKQKEHST